MTEISRDELLRGLPARRATMLLFAIQNRTAQLVARSRWADLVPPDLIVPVDARRVPVEITVSGIAPAEAAGREE